MLGLERINKHWHCGHARYNYKLLQSVSQREYTGRGCMRVDHILSRQGEDPRNGSLFKWHQVCFSQEWAGSRTQVESEAVRGMICLTVVAT